MGFLDRLFGRGRAPEERRSAYPRRDFDGDYSGGYDRDYDRGYDAPPRSADEQALARYRYMLRTAPPEAIEQAHQEAFAKLTPQQRALALRELAQTVPPHERAGSDDPRSLARMATRAELRQPGLLERVFGGVGMGGGMGMGGMGMGGLIAGSLLSSLAGSFIGTAIAQEFFDNDTGFNDLGLDNPDIIGDPAGGIGEEYAGQDLPTQDLGAEEFAGQDLATQDFGGEEFAAGDFGDMGDFGGEV